MSELVSSSHLFTVTVKLNSVQKKPVDSIENFQVVSRDDFSLLRGAHPDSIKLVEEFAKNHGLQVLESSVNKRHVMLQGVTSQFESAFGVEMVLQNGFITHRGRVVVPNHLLDHVEAVLGLDQRPIAKPHFRPRTGSSPVPMTAIQVANLYSFPTNVNGSGQSIAIIELGGGHNTNDLNTYFSNLGLQTPSLTSVSVLGATSSPGGEADGEVMLDIEVAGTVANHANIVVYYAPNTEQGFLQAITEATHDHVHNPSVMSISWGGPEIAWSRQAMLAMNNAIKDAASLGITVTVASGDNGSDDGVGDGRNHVDFPASSPYALSCGGTQLVGSGSSITSETVWNSGGGAGGGGFSTTFMRPNYQNGSHHHSSRGVPDICGNADPSSGYEIVVDGQSQVVGGTSAVAPLWAGLVALFNQSLGKRIGFINPLLYQKVPSSAFNDIVQGNNGAFFAGHGWDACTGLGSPIGTTILTRLHSVV